MKNEFNADIEIDIPHLRFKVYVSDMNKLKGLDKR